MKLLSAAIIAAITSMPALAMERPSLSHPSCDDMLRRLAKARDDALRLNNTRFPMVNWARNKLAPGFDSERYAVLNEIALDNFNVNMAGGGRGGYFSTSDFIDPNASPEQIRGAYDSAYDWFQINIGAGASCNLSDW